jgi:hypothetical protein
VSNRGKPPPGKNAYIVGAILFLLLLAVALVFAVILKPADQEYNNTIPAVMGVLTLLGTVVATLVNMLNLNAKHRENTTKLDKVISSDEPADG